MPGRRVSRDQSTRGRHKTDAEEERPRPTAPEDLEDEEQTASGDPEDEADLHDEAGGQEDEPARSDGRQSAPRMSAAAAARAAMRAIAELIGRKPESLTALEPSEDGWHVAVEVLEDQRVPSSADILATYEADLDSDGTLMAYRRTGRYQRGRADASKDG
jgi:hypothetical protein